MGHLTFIQTTNVMDSRIKNTPVTLESLKTSSSLGILFNNAYFITFFAQILTTKKPSKSTANNNDIECVHLLIMKYKENKRPLLPFLLNLF